MNSLLKDKVIFLTGGSCGIGQDCAKAYAAAGAKVTIAAIDREGVERVTAELGRDHAERLCEERIREEVHRLGVQRGIYCTNEWAVGTSCLLRFQDFEVIIGFAPLGGQMTLISCLSVYGHRADETEELGKRRPADEEDVIVCWPGLGRKKRH